MLTFTTFALLALSLFTTFMAITAMRREREELHKNVSTLDYVLKLEKELTSLYEQRAERESLLVEKTQQIHDLQIALFETKEEYVPWIEQLQQEINDLDDQVRALDNKSYIDLAEIEDLKFKLEATQIDLDVANACIWDKEKQISDKQEILNEVAAELFSLGFRDGIIKDVEVLRIRDLALEQDIPF